MKTLHWKGDSNFPVVIFDKNHGAPLVRMSPLRGIRMCTSVCDCCLHMDVSMQKGDSCSRGAIQESVQEKTFRS